jgi:hypothetical protein
MGIDLATRRFSHSLSKLAEGTGDRFTEAVKKASAGAYTVDDLKVQITGTMLQMFDVWTTSFHLVRSPGVAPLDRRLETAAAVNSGSPVRGTVVLEKPRPGGTVFSGPAMVKTDDATKTLTGIAALGHPLNDEVSWTVTRGGADPAAVAGTYRGDVKIGAEVIATVELKLT